PEILALSLHDALPICDMLGFWDRLAYGHAAELADFLMRQYLDAEVDEVHLIYNEFRSVAVQRPVLEQLLPIPRAEAGEGRATTVDRKSTRLNSSHVST